MRRRVLTVLLPVVAVLTALALVAGTSGIATARPDAAKRSLVKTVKKVSKKVAKKVVRKQAPKLTVGNAAALGGRAPAAYLTQSYSIDIAGVSNVASFDKTLPAVPAGTYQATLYLTASLTSASANMFCSLSQDGVAVDLLDAYAAPYGSFRTITASRVVTVGGPLRLFCRPTAGNILAVPANPEYAPAQLQLVRVDANQGLGTSS
ncbi:hypothetical protein [Nocardioides flavescens]|uniref:Uncharacterized protein n=1 Tax=Nocardioides flavescens TaxID=2691959 RepID=A0A6L7F1K1_9ACTN|nr:hypothetical protein [Nocardioides flavescens]MXG90362.1 hypothetical protein [Nocardioides flavescens]